MDKSLTPIRVETDLLAPRPLGLRPALFLDLDGTVRSSPETYPLPGRQAVIPEALYRAWEYRRSGHWVFGVSNQTEVARGGRTREQVVDAVREMNLLAGGLFDAVYVCPHDREKDGAACECKKPLPGMGRRAMSEFSVDLPKSLMVGDREQDRGFAENLGARWEPVEEFMAEVRDEDPGAFDRDRALGALWGLACGDSLGANLEFLAPELIREKYGTVTEMLEGNWSAGAPTDDTDLALIWLRHFAEGGDGYSYSAREDLSRRLKVWLDRDPKDVGKQTSDAILGSKRLPAALAALAAWEHTGRRAAGNGGLMRCAPVAVRHWNSKSRRLAASLAGSALTHADPRSLWACAALNEAIAALIRGEPEPEHRAHFLVRGAEPEVAQALADAPHFNVKSADLKTNMGFVLLGLKVAFSELTFAKSFESALIEVINRGGDADTNGAIAGALLGARFGKSQIPARWLDRLQVKTELEQLFSSLVPQVVCQSGIGE